MKSRSVRVFLFGVAAVLTVLLAVALSKPVNVVAPDDEALPSVNDTALQTVYDDDFSSEEVTEPESSEDISESSSVVVDVTAESTTAKPETSTKPPESTTKKAEVTSAKPETTTKKPETTTKAQILAPQETTPRVTTTAPAQHIVENDSMTVYVTKSGKHYHYANPCGNGTYYESTLGEAKKKGLTPCAKCVH